MCGEKCYQWRSSCCEKGSPPRVRGKDMVNNVDEGNLRITPACAGKRSGCLQNHGVSKDHPRVCGEKNAWEGDRDD